MTKKQITESFLGKMKQRYPHCATTFFEVNGDGFASVSLAVERKDIQLDVDYDAPKYHGYDAVDIIDKKTGKVLFQKTGGYPGARLDLAGLLALAEKAFDEVVSGNEKHIGRRQTIKR